jgi:hypothetical protein
MQAEFKELTTVYVCVEPTKIVYGKEATVKVLVRLQSYGVAKVVAKANFKGAVFVVLIMATNCPH